MISTSFGILGSLCFAATVFLTWERLIGLWRSKEDTKVATISLTARSMSWSEEGGGIFNFYYIHTLNIAGNGPIIARKKLPLALAAPLAADGHAAPACNSLPNQARPV